MKQLTKYALILAVSLGSVWTLQAQKFGYLNSALIISELPETKAADSKMEAFQKQLENEGQGKAKVLQEKYAKYMQEAQSGTLTRIQMQEQESALTKGQEELGVFEQEAMTKIQKKREELYEPILVKVQNAIDAVGKENGYQFIFDVGVMNAVLYADEAEDVSDLVRAKL